MMIKASVSSVAVCDVIVSQWCRRYYSMYGHIETLAKEIKRGAESVEGVEVTLYQVSF